MNSEDGIWKPHVTVAAIVERDGRFLVVEEETDHGPQFNQPAGHLDPGESLIEAVRRETLEETAYRFDAQSLVGIYHHRVPATGITYLRFAFAGTLGAPVPGRTLDTGIIRAAWLTTEELRQTASRHRTPLVLRCVEDYLAGKRYPLDLLQGTAV